MPWEMQYRGFGDPKSHPQSEPDFVGETEYVQNVWERELAYTTAPGTKWIWPRCSAVGGKTNFWGRSSARFAARVPIEPPPEQSGPGCHPARVPGQQPGTW